MILLFVLLGAALVQILAERFYTKNWEKQLSVSVKFKDGPVREGEEGVLTETIENRKYLFLPMLQAAFGVSRNLNFSAEENTSVSDKSYKRDIFSVMGNQRIIRQVPFLAQKRGYYEIKQIELMTKGPLMTRNLFSTCVNDTYLYVYPKKLSGKEWDVLLQKITGTVAARKRLLEDPFEFRGIREYTTSDSMSRINWKASARTGNLMVNLQDSTTSGNVYLLLDIGDETIWKYEEIHEAGISLAAAFTEAFLLKGIDTGLITNGTDCMTGEEIMVPAGTGKGQQTRLFQSLSRIDLSGTPRKFSDCLEEKMELLLSKESFCILITKNQYKELAEKMQVLADKNQGGLYLATLYEEMELRVTAKNGMKVWRLEVKK